MNRNNVNADAEEDAVVGQQFKMKILTRYIFIFIVLVSLPVSSFAQDDWDDEESEEESDEEESKEEQPPVTAGGLYRKDNYPLAALDRPMLMARGLMEARIELETDVSENVALENWFNKVGMRYGVTDSLEVFGSVYSLLAGEAPVGGIGSVGVETGVYHDIVNFRTSLDLTFRKCCATRWVVGLPIRYRPKKEVAIIALDKILTIHFADQKPDLTVGVGGILQPHPFISVLVRGELILPAFDADAMTIPVQAAVQVTPTRNLDLGLAATLSNLKNENDRFANRSVLLFSNIRL